GGVRRAGALLPATRTGAPSAALARHRVPEGGLMLAAARLAEEHQPRRAARGEGRPPSSGARGRTSADLALVAPHVEVVAPRGDLPVAHLEDTRDGEGDLLASDREVIDALGEDHVAPARDGEDLEVDIRGWRDEQVQHLADRRVAAHRPE